LAADWVTYALKEYTDYSRFEQLAREVLRLEGFSRIEPYGGNKDGGRDAVQESLSHDPDQRTVFQFSLQEDVKGKVQETVAKLKKNGIEFRKLVYATNRDVSATLRDELKTEVRRDSEATLEIYDTNRIVPILGDPKNGLMARFFPDLRAQLETQMRGKPSLLGSISTEEEKSLLRSSILYVQSPGSQKARKSILDQLVLSGVSRARAGSTIEEIISALKQIVKLTVTLEVEQVKASLDRLAGLGLVKPLQSGVVVLSPRGGEEMASATVAAEVSAAGLADEVLSKLERTRGRRVDPNTAQAIRQNVLQAFASFFHHLGFEVAATNMNIAAATSKVHMEDVLVREAKRNLDPQMGELLVAVLADVLRSPTAEQARVLRIWGLAFIGTQLMLWDPTLRELQVSRLAKKSFSLDTDFVLDCIVSHTPLSAPSLLLLQRLMKAGCKVVIPSQCLRECRTHLAYATRTYDYFGRALLSLPERTVDRTVENVVVKGYYYGITSGALPPETTFGEFLSNYWEPRQPEAFLMEVIKAKLPELPTVTDVEKLAKQPIPAAQLIPLEEYYYELASGSAKGTHRTQAENRALAKTDAVLFLGTYYSNDPSELASGRIMPGSHYLVTSSARYTRGAAKLGMEDRVTTSPTKLHSMLDLIGEGDISAADFVSLLENPFLAHAVKAAWPQIDRLTQMGVQLRGKEMARLRHDFDEGMHRALVDVGESTKDKKVDGSAAVEVDAGSYIKLLETAKSLGYGLIPEVGQIVKRVEEADARRSASEEELRETREMLETVLQKSNEFGVRKRRYLRKMARRTGLRPSERKK
jgi:hypothetical protein